MKFNIIAGKKMIIYTPYNCRLHTHIECKLRRKFHFDVMQAISSDFWFSELYDKFMFNSAMVEILIEEEFEKNIKYVRRERG